MATWQSRLGRAGLDGKREQGGMSQRSGFSAAMLFLAVFAVLLGGGTQAWITRSKSASSRFDPAIQVMQRSPSATSSPLSSSLPSLANRCAVCHPGVCQDLAEAPHSRTLRAGNDPDVLARFAGRRYQQTSGGPTIAFEERVGELWMKSDSYPDALRVDWMFGSGRHALTPVSLLVNPQGATELVEGSVSWFHGDLLGPTPGANLARGRGIASLGTPHDHATSRDCFGCHVTQLTMDRGRIHSDGLERGVSCERCHPGGERHATSMEAGGPLAMERWSELTPLESVNRCGECHRRADHLTPQELSPERPVLVRFASIGLVMSPCFQKQDLIQAPDGIKGAGGTTRLDCLTCHDPHRSAEEPVETFVEKCQQCHGPQANQARVCSSTQTATNCLPCHMPPVNVTDNLILTDHWIRIRKPTDPPVATSTAR
jgi:hypothetical protein